VSPRAGRRVHLSLLLAWLIIGTPVSMWLRYSIPWLVFLSVYAIVVGHWSGWSAERPTELAEPSGG
jgi:hypothetical protein